MTTYNPKQRYLISPEVVFNLKPLRKYELLFESLEPSLAHCFPKKTKGRPSTPKQALRNALLYHRALQTARIDPLTGVRNRATMDSAIHREIELARRHDTPLSVILLDIDHFNQINDQYGHLSGDQALKSIAQCADRTIRESDMIFRYGGEEFLVLLSGTDSDGAGQLAERIRENVERLNPHIHKSMNLTVSLGVAGMRNGDDSGALFKRADTALYKAKQQGRNRVVMQ